MRSYEACATEATSSRSVASLFRAVGNLALSSDNMKRFMDAEIESAFASFLGQADEDLDDATIEACLRTLSNLVIEKDNMKKFSVVIIPFLSLLRKERHTSSNTHRWAFITLASLCRWSENAKLFAENAGIDTVTMLIDYLEPTPALLSSVILVLGIQTTYPDNVTKLLSFGNLELMHHPQTHQNVQSTLN